MKTKIYKKSTWQSILSAGVFGLFVWMALASEPTEVNSYLGDGIYQHYYHPGPFYGSGITTQGPNNEYGRWHGVVNIYYGDYPYNAHEMVNMVDGERHGISLKTDLKNDIVTKSCYHMGQAIPCEEKQQARSTGSAVYEVLEKKYPWFLFGWESVGVSPDEMMIYIDALLKEMDVNEPEPWTFDLYFDQAWENLRDLEEYEKFASSQRFISGLVTRRHFENYELRRAVIDHHRSDNESTFVIIARSYPGYLDHMTSRISEEDFLGFCSEVDNRMGSFPILDRNDPLFVDSIDLRLNVVMLDLLINEGKGMNDLVELAKKSTGNWSGLSRIWREILAKADTKSESHSPGQVAFRVMVDMDEKSKQADPFRLAVREVYMPDEVRMPSLGAEFLGVMDGHMALHCIVVSDGGCDVTSRGVVYGPTFNPTMSDQVIEYGGGTGEFFANIPIEDPSEKLFARAYAINSRHIAYSNQVEVVPDQTTGLVHTPVSMLHVEAYPIPASNLLWVTTQGPMSGETTISLINTSGQVVASEVAGASSPLSTSQVDGGIRVSLNVEGLQSGVYFVRVASGGETGVARVVIR